MLLLLTTMKATNKSQGGNRMPKTATITLDPTSGAVGSPVNVHGANFDAAGEFGTVTVGSDIVASFKVAANKIMNAYFEVPTSASGEVTVTATAGNVSASAQFTVTA